MIQYKPFIKKFIILVNQIQFNQTTAPFLQLNIWPADLMIINMFFFVIWSLVLSLRGLTYFFCFVLKFPFLISYSVFCFSFLKHQWKRIWSNPWSHHPHSSSITACHNRSREVVLCSFWERMWITELGRSHCDTSSSSKILSRVSVSLFVLKGEAMEHLMGNLYWQEEHGWGSHSKQATAVSYEDLPKPKAAGAGMGADWTGVEV